LVIRHEPEGQQIALAQLSNGRKRLGSRSEVQRFRVEVDEGLLVIGFTPGNPPKLLHELAVRTPICRTYAYVYARLGSVPLEVVRTCGARMHLHGKDVSAAPGKNAALACVAALHAEMPPPQDAHQRRGTFENVQVVQHVRITRSFVHPTRPRA